MFSIYRSTTKSLQWTSLKFFFSTERHVRPQMTHWSSWSITATESSPRWHSSATGLPMVSSFNQTRSKPPSRWLVRQRCRTWMSRLQTSTLRPQWHASAWSGSSQTTLNHYQCRSSTRWWRTMIFLACLYPFLKPSLGSAQTEMEKKRSLRIRSGLWFSPMREVNWLRSRPRSG